MVKKKTPEEEQERHDETSDIKADNHIKKDTDQTGSVAPPSEDPAGEADKPAGEEDKASDKVVKEGSLPEEKLAEMQDKYLRLSAEFDNYRKRTLREKMELSKYANEDVLLKILPVMDDFERALVNMETATDCAAIKSGIDLIYVKLTDFLKQNEISEIESLNCAFNVDLHDAVTKTHVEDESKKGLIVDVVKKGYYLKDKVIRHAKVVIGE
ncbi:MAG: nucleotide exchange factor GrpE [Bacteroidia bacterium]|nr:nucleotide exchange factor GrpE [Bacteroidia bacterium]